MPASGGGSRDTGRTLREVLGVEAGAISWRRMIGFVLGMVAADLAIYVYMAGTPLPYLLRAGTIFPAFAFRAAMEAMAFLVGLRFLKKARFAAPAAGIVYMVLIVIQSALGGRLIALPKVLAMPFFVGTICLLLALGYFVKRIERVWLALFLGATIGYFVRTLAENWWVHRSLMLNLIPRDGFLVLVGAAVFTAVFMVMAIGTWRKN